MNVPVLHTARLTLREQRPSDTEPLMAAFADEEFSRFITREGRALTRVEAWRPIAFVPGSWAVSGYGQWLVEERATGLPVGRIGPWEPEGWPGFEIGWSIFPGHQRQGYAVEGAAAAFSWVHDALGRDEVIHLIDPRNIASERVASALGAEPTGSWSLPGHDDPVRVWTSHWARFTATEAWRRHVAAAPSTP